MLSDGIDILKMTCSLYENFDDFNRPERRIVGRSFAILKTQAASNRIENGEIDFVGLVRNEA